MSGFGLVRVDGGGKVKLSLGETVLGRGPFLGISDTRVSRHHGLLENLNGQLRLKPTHVNPCFIRSSLNDDPRPLEKGSWHQLHPGDLLSLLPGHFIYRVDAVGEEESTPRNSQNLQEEEGELPVPADVAAPPTGGSEQEQISDPDGNEPSRGFRQDDSTRWTDVQSHESPPAPRRRVLPAWMMAAVTAPKTPAAAPKAQSGVKRSKPAAASSATQATPPNLSSLPSGVKLRDEEERPTKKSRKLSREEEDLPTETEVLSEESTSRLQVKPSRSGVSSDFDHLSMELEDEGKGEGPSQTPETRKSSKEEKSRVRTACPYGKDCYRKNPLHFNECSHPGDSDYEEEDRAECPYGTSCYRKNPLHRKEFKHTKKPAPSTRSVFKTTPEEDVSDDDDSFINDDSDDLGNDSDYVPPGLDDSEQEDVQRLQEEATTFLKKGRR